MCQYDLLNLKLVRLVLKIAPTDISVNNLYLVLVVRLTISNASVKLWILKNSCNKRREGGRSVNCKLIRFVLLIQLWDRRDEPKIVLKKIRRGRAIF